jgi:3-phenylpropionate/cinnamic acid dioxygenase small subunit
MIVTKITPELHLEIQTFLLREVEYLDDNRLNEWLTCLAEDVHYFMPIRSHAQPKQTSNHNPVVSRFAYYDDDKSSLRMRVDRIATGIAHAEAPRSFTQRLISNVRVEATERASEFSVLSSFLAWQERRGRDLATFMGRRSDIIRIDNGALKIARRQVDLAQTILPGTISIFF